MSHVRSLGRGDSVGATPGARHLIFLHVPKAAGSTLEQALARQHPRERVFVLDGTRPHESLDAFKRLPPEQRSRISLLAGHMQYGVHECFAERSTYVAMIRHPVKRLISHYRFVLRRPGHYLYQTVTARKMGLEEYVQSGISTETDNGQVRLLAGHDQDVPHGKCSGAMLEKAKRHILQHFTCVGISEEFDRSLVLMSRRLNWAKVPAYLRVNVAPSPAQTVSEKTIRTIEGFNTLDLELYEWVRLRLLSEWETEREHLDRILHRFVVRNRVYQTVTQPFRPFDRFARRVVWRLMTANTGR